MDSANLILALGSKKHLMIYHKLNAKSYEKNECCVKTKKIGRDEINDWKGKRYNVKKIVESKAATRGKGSRLLRAHPLPWARPVSEATSITVTTRLAFGRVCI